MIEPPKCDLCGEPMPLGEEMFKIHGYSGDCPRPPRARPQPLDAKDAQIADLTRQLEDARKQPWRYVDGPGEGADPRCLVTLEEDRMRWVGIRAWNANTGQWLNGGEPERARVMAWQPLPVPASGYWQHGKLVNTERT